MSESIHQLKKVRMELNLSREDLAVATLLSSSTIKRAENNEPLNEDVISQICQYISKQFHREVTLEELGLNRRRKSRMSPNDNGVSYTSDEEAVLEKDTESEEAMNRREATKAMGALIGSTLISTPHDILNPQPWEQFAKVVDSSSKIKDFSHFKSLTQTSWHLLKASELDVLEQVLSAYLPKLTPLIQEQAHRKTAANLASQGYQILGILEGHKLNLHQRRKHQQQAVDFSRLAEDKNVQSAAEVQLASAFQYLNDPEKVLQIYESVLPFIEQISPLQKSCVYLGLADASVQCDKEQDALRYLGLAREVFPEQPENDQSFLFSDAGYFSLALYEGLTHLGLGNAREALEAFEQITKYPDGATPERVRVEIINHEAQTAIAMRDQELFKKYLLSGLEGATRLGSEKRRQEVWSAYGLAKNVWYNDKGIILLRKDLLDIEAQARAN